MLEVPANVIPAPPGGRVAVGGAHGGKSPCRRRRRPIAFQQGHLRHPGGGVTDAECRRTSWRFDFAHQLKAAIGVGNAGHILNRRGDGIQRRFPAVGISVRGPASLRGVGRAGGVERAYRACVPRLAAAACRAAHVRGSFMASKTRTRPCRFSPRTFDEALHRIVRRSGGSRAGSGRAVASAGFWYGFLSSRGRSHRVSPRPDAGVKVAPAFEAVARRRLSSVGSISSRRGRWRTETGGRHAERRR